jgi:hypothetical protein
MKAEWHKPNATCFRFQLEAVQREPSGKYEK